jgi:hypothetical protein
MVLFTFLSNSKNLGTKSYQFLSSKKFQVLFSITVSKSHHHLNAKIAFQFAIASIGTIQKSSSPGNINQELH